MTPIFHFRNMTQNFTQHVPFYHHSLGFTFFSLCLCLTLSTALHEVFWSVFLMHVLLSTQWLHHGDQTPEVRCGVDCGWRRNSLSARHTGLCRTVKDTVFHGTDIHQLLIWLFSSCDCIMKFQLMGKLWNILTKEGSQAWDWVRVSVSWTVIKIHNQSSVLD